MENKNRKPLFMIEDYLVPRTNMTIKHIEECIKGNPKNGNKPRKVIIFDIDESDLNVIKNK